MNERTLKSGLISGTLDIGSAIVTKVINNKPRYKYHIPTKRAEKYMGISYEDFLKMR
jgi:putative UDP-3-O-[3-hydroxymyristoyl] glucosamine N-acyltransferase